MGYGPILYWVLAAAMVWGAIGLSFRIPEQFLILKLL